MRPKKKTKRSVLTPRKIALPKKEEAGKVVLARESRSDSPPCCERDLWGFTRAGEPAWFSDVYHHRSLVFYETQEGAEKVKEYGEKVARVKVKVSYE